MANRTVKDATTIKGTNPQYLVEKIIRTRIYDSRYWKEECFALSAELLVDKAMDLKYIGGVYGGNIKPTPFLCLVQKMLQIQPDKDIIVEFIKNDDCKYVRCLGAYYMRLTGKALDCYKYLEPLLSDYRKIKVQNRDGTFTLSNMDQFVDDLIREERQCDVILPRLQKRHVLEEMEQLEPRVSPLDDDMDELGESSDEEPEEEAPPSPQHHYNDRHMNERSYRRRSQSPRESRHRRQQSPSPPRYPRRSRTRSPPPQRSHRDRDTREHRGDQRHRDRSSPAPARRSSRSPRRRRRSRTPPPPPSSRRQRDRSPAPHRTSSSTTKLSSKRRRDDDESKSRKEKRRHRHKEDKNEEEGGGSSHKKKKKHSKKDKEAEDLREQQELRAKLGLKPLRT